MQFMPAIFKIERNSIIPIMRVTGVIKQMPEVEKILLYKAVEIFEKAEKFGGRAVELSEKDNMDDIPENMIAVRISIIFKNEEDFQKAISSIKEGLG